MTPPVQAGVARPEVVTDRVDPGKPGWLQLATSADHKAVGRMYVATALTFLAAAITLLLLQRIQLIVPDSTIIRPEIFNRLFSAYGVTGVLLFAIPLFLGLISYVVPLQIGARAAALPRLGALSYWLYLAGGVTIYASFLYRPSEAGTLALPPLSSDVFSLTNGVDAWAAGVGLVALGFVCFAINMIATVRHHRAPGMVWRRVPLFSFAATVVSWVLLVIGPVMIAAVSMLMIDRNFGGIFFVAGEGGAPLLYAHLAWFFFTGVYVAIVLCAFGAISEILATLSRQPQFGQRAIEGSMVAFAVLGVLAWMQNMYSAPIPIGFLYFAMAMAIALVIPAGIIVFNWIGTLRGGSPEMRPPLKFAVAAAVLMILGLAGEWAGSVIPVAWQVANTGVAWGDTHFALVGAGVLGGFAALYYWYPKLTGRYMGRTLAGGSLWLIVVGTVLMVIPIQLAGLAGMPVDVSEYYADTGMSTYNLLGSIGAFILITGVVLTLVNATASYNRGTRAGPDPWRGSTLEWFALSPPPPHNFDLVPDVRSNEPFREIREAVRRRSTELVLPAAGSGAEPEAAPAPAVAEPSNGGDGADAPGAAAEPAAGESAAAEPSEPAAEAGPGDDEGDRPAGAG